jgi:hypothetical protein
MSAVLLYLLLSQSADYAPALKATADTQRREAELRRVAATSTRAAPSTAEEIAKQYAAARDQEFVEKFNKLINTLMEFADAYKNGQTIDLKKAQAVRKAWLDLEKSEAVFQDNKKIVP